MARSAARAALFLVPVLLAATLRLPGLGARPMHADEAVHADKLGTLLEGGGYAYDPAEYHGPTLYYLTLPSAWAAGERRYVDLRETTLRLVPAALGVALVAAHLGAAAFLGTSGALSAALLAALSPAMVFYSRYYIHETPLVLFTFAALLGFGWYSRRPGLAPAVFAGASVGLAHATKETAPLAFAAAAASLALVLLLERRAGRARASLRGTGRGRDVLAGFLAAAVVAALLLSSFGSNPGGVVDSFRTYGIYLERAGAASWHFHPWHYYLGLLARFPAEGTPFWTEGLVLALALVGGAAAFSRRGVSGTDRTALRFLALYTLVLTAAYSAIPYKTPWCVLGFLHGMILLAGAGTVVLLRWARGAARAAVAALLAAAAVWLGVQASLGSFRYASDPRNPWVYAHTTPDVFAVVERLRLLAGAHPGGLAMPVFVVSRDNLWPLPWYLREFRGIGWWNGVSDEAAPAPVFVVTPDMEPALVRRLYDVPPPGERELYVSIFDTPVFLRPGVELRGYAAGSLREASLRVEQDRPAGAP